MKLKNIIVALTVIATLTLSAFAQRPNEDQKGQGDVREATIVYSDRQAEKMPIVSGANLYCTGYITRNEISANVEIVGATEEKDRHIYTFNDDIYLNSGTNNGVKVGDMFSVIRPRGKVNTKWTKKGKLGTWVQEVGAVEVIAAKSDYSVARIRSACDTILFGDLVEPTPKRTSPLFKKRGALDLYSDPSGRASGQIVMARDGAELLGREMIVYVDLGREDNVQVGDYLTIYRGLGSGNLSKKIIKSNSIDNKEDGYESDRYQGGHFSIQSSRKKGKNAGGKTVSMEGAKSRRPAGLRRVVGEMVVISVRESTATAVIVRAATEIHTGDNVEQQ